MNVGEVERVLKAFALMVEMGLVDSKKENTKLIKKVTRILEKEDPMIFVTKDGPITLATLRWFGIAHPHKGKHRLDEIDPELVCKFLVAWEKFKLKMVEIYNAPDIFQEADFEFAPVNLSITK